MFRLLRLARKAITQHRQQLSKRDLRVTQQAVIQRQMRQLNRLLLRATMLQRRQLRAIQLNKQQQRERQQSEPQRKVTAQSERQQKGR
jgi:hypothetical protein